MALCSTVCTHVSFFPRSPLTYDHCLLQLSGVLGFVTSLSKAFDGSSSRQRFGPGWLLGIRLRLDGRTGQDFVASCLAASAALTPGPCVALQALKLDFIKGKPSMPYLLHKQQHMCIPSLVKASLSPWLKVMCTLLAPILVHAQTSHCCLAICASRLGHAR